MRCARDDTPGHPQAFAIGGARAGKDHPRRGFAIAFGGDFAKGRAMTYRPLCIRSARQDDLAALVALYGDDDIGVSRELAGPDAAYQAAFDAIQSDPNHVLVVGERDGQVVATLLLSFLPGLSRHGAWRAQIEAMRVARPLRGQGLGRALLDWSIDEARGRGCMLVQLTSDRRRDDAHRFYEGAGFEPTHLGYKLSLETP
jgi:GNAT superfamily N-acetyltransferase